MDQLLSFDLHANFGFLRKPDTNDGISMSYNMLHKPALLGILGALLGYEGYQTRGELPEYYHKLSDIPVGIQPLASQNGNFPKLIINYTNTVGYANRDGNFIAYENTLIKPSYRVYLALPKEHDLVDYISGHKAEYLPYLGKNEFPLWWDNVQKYPLNKFEFSSDYTVSSVFIKVENESVRAQEAEKSGGGIMDFLSDIQHSFFYFERLPVDFTAFNSKRGTEYQYRLQPFAYTNARFNKSWQLENLYELPSGETVQLF